MRRLFLDDNSERHRLFSTWYPDAVRVCTQEVPGNTYCGTYGESELTGQDAAIHVARLPEDKRPTQVVIHSWNPPGATRMLQLLRDAGVRAIRAPFEYD